MLSIFLGLTTANLLLLGVVAVVGWTYGQSGSAAAAQEGMAYHVALGVASGFLTCLTHLAVYTYFMATSKWLQAAADKADLNLIRYVAPSLSRKKRVLPTVMIPIFVTMFTLFAGAAADSVTGGSTAAGVHLATAAAAVVCNVAAAGLEYHWINQQRQLMDDALSMVNRLSPAETRFAEMDARVSRA